MHFFLRDRKAKCTGNNNHCLNMKSRLQRFVQFAATDTPQIAYSAQDSGHLSLPSKEGLERQIGVWRYKLQTEKCKFISVLTLQGWNRTCSSSMTCICNVLFFLWLKLMKIEKNWPKHGVIRQGLLVHVLETNELLNQTVGSGEKIFVQAK